MFTKLKIRTRLAIVVLVPVIALLALAALGYRTLYSSQIGSKSYDNIVLAKDLVADVLPPPEYIVESYNLTLQLADETDPAAISAGIEHLTALEKVYEDRHAYWASVLTPGTALRTELIDTSYAAARTFFDAVDTEFVPALQGGDATTARQILDSKLTPAYLTHRASIDKVVKAAGEQVAFRESYANKLVHDRTVQLLAALALVGLLIVVVSTLIARSIIRPVKQLTAAASRAEEQLPAVVASAHSGTGGEVVAFTPVTVDSRDELGSLADALNQMQSTAVQLATEQAHTRRNVSTMLANLARRNQSLLNRTLSFISQLEENERDPETLENLFKLDHLATRMRRNAESLLVLAGADPPRTWPRPIEVAEIVRAALSEIEAYDRVELNQVETVWVRGNVVSDLTHLLAELLDNATRFSPPTTQVSVVGKLTDRGYLVSVIDQGMGMNPVDLARANADLESIGRFEERSTMVLGLAVVGRLAARSGIQVRLTESPFEGVTAQVRVPFELLQTPTAEPSNAIPAATPTGPNLRPATPLVGATRGPVPAGAAEPVAVAAAAVAAATASIRANPARPEPAAAAAQAPMAAPPSTPSVRGPATEAPAAAPAPGRVPMPPGSGGPSSLPTRTPPPPPAAVPPPPASAVPPPPPPASTAPPPPPVARPVAAEPPPAPRPAPAPAPAPTPTTPGGLVQRVPGAQLFESGPGDLPPPPVVDRSAESIRDALSSFQYGFQRRPAVPPRRDEEDA